MMKDCSYFSHFFVDVCGVSCARIVDVTWREDSQLWAGDLQDCLCLIGTYVHICIQHLLQWPDMCHG